MERTIEADRTRPACKGGGRAFSGTRLSNIHTTPSNTPMETEALDPTTSAGQANTVWSKGKQNNRDALYNLQYL